MKVRKFKKMSEIEQLYELIKALTFAISTHPQFHDVKVHRTDLIGVACQFNKNIKREDFDIFKSLTLEDIINVFDKDFNTSRK